MTEKLENYQSQVVLARTEIKNLRQQLIAMKNEHQKEIRSIKSVLSELRCAKCADTATTVTTNENGQPSSLEASDCITYKAIGIIETCFQNKRAVPRQPSVLANVKGVVVINSEFFNNPNHALDGLQEFSHMWIIFHFHITESCNMPAKVAPPRLRGERRGVFSTRSPLRPCPIGLSLVKIQSIEGNKIHFTGVDMVNGTPVLDIKPYIPQYDYPIPIFDNETLSTMVRPPTEGNSDIIGSVMNLQIGGTNFDDNSVNPRLTNSLGVVTPNSSFEDETSPGNELGHIITPSPDSPSSIDLLDGGTFRPRTPLRRPDSERGAPDGQERFTPPQSAHLLNITHDGIRIAPWIANPPAQVFEVRFTDDALSRLLELIGDRAMAFKTNIETLLSEDPRSQYVRTRYPDHEYSCVLEDICVSCVFDNNSWVCTIIAVRSAEEMQ